MSVDPGVVASAGRGEAGRLTIGFHASLTAGNLRATLIEYRRKCRLLEMRLVQDLRGRLLAGVESGAIDVAIVTGDPSAGNGGAMALWSERVLVALPEGHPLAALGGRPLAGAEGRNLPVVALRFGPRAP
jgi:DNA-binding transcriptional LysR family regulator